MGHTDNTGTFDIECCEYFYQNMSRRKQSNPKPVKRQADSEAEDSEMTEKLQSNERDAEENNQSNDLSQSEDENEPMETEDTKQNREEHSSLLDKKDNDCDRLENGHVSPSLLEVMKKCNFPSDILTLKKVDESVCYETGIPWIVSSSIPLPKGSSIGPYTGKVVPLSELKEKEHILQAGDNKFAFVSLTDKTGAWLTLLRPVDKSAAHNTCVYFKGERIWCETVDDLSVGTELVASFTIVSQPVGTDKPCDIIKQEATTPFCEDEVNKGVNSIGGKIDIKTKQQLPPQPALIFGCPFCGVRFSSPRTLEAHVTYYCSKKPPDLQKIPVSMSSQMPAETEGENKQDRDHGSASPISDGEPSRTSVKRAHDDVSSDSATSPSDNEAPKSKSPKSGQTFKCGSCDYTADRMSSLNRHKRIHSRGLENSASSERLSVSPVCQSETFCKDCNIQFSSLSTYRGHREFYCKFRQREKSEDSISVGASPPLKDINKLSPNLISPPSGLLTKGLLQPNTIPHPLNLAVSPLLMQAIPKDLQAFFARHRDQDLPPNNSSLNRLSRTETGSYKLSDDQPLDLSTSKSKNQATDSDTEEKTKASSPISVKTEQKTSPQHSPDLGKLHSPAIPRADGKIDSVKLGGPIVKPTLKVPIFPTNPVQFVKNKPIPPLSSVSRCVECNIVFYKHENYLIHKEHYCSGRRGGMTLDGDEQKLEQELPKSPKTHISPGSKQVDPEAAKTRESVSPSSPKLPKGDNSQGPLKPSDLCYLYYCIPCNIKFSSAGTLKAHKEFYCPHGKDNDTACVIKDNADVDSDKTGSDSNDLYRCELCHSEYTSARLLKLHLCSGLATQTPLLRCPYCEYVTQTENRLSEHMKVHVPTKAFKCTLCGYRGNTARGMRMHGKMHLENGEEFTDDNMIEFEEPPLVPVQRNGVCDKGPIDIETELIRMKNEPYKRRRSRKSFEKSENMPSYISPELLPQICAACGQPFVNVNEFVIHLRMHEMAALEAMKNLKSLKCEHCDDYIAESLTGLLFHMHERHPEQLPNTSRSDNQSESEGERSQSRDSHRSASLGDRSRSNSEESSRTSTVQVNQQEKDLSNESVNKMVKSDQSDIPKNSDIVQNVKTEKVESTFDSEAGSENDTKSKDSDFRSERSVIKDSSRNPVTSDDHCTVGISSPEPSGDGMSKPLCSPPQTKSPPRTQHIASPKSSVSPPSERLWYLKPPTPHQSPHSSSGLPAENSGSTLVRTSQAGAVSPPRGPAIFPIQTGSVPLPALQRNPLSPQQHSLSPWKQHIVSPLASALKSEPVSPLRQSQSENQRISPFSVSVKKEVDSSPTHSSQRPSNPPTPVTSPQMSLPRTVISPHLSHFPLLYSPQALMQLYQFQHGMQSAMASLSAGTGNTSETSTEENSSKKYCEHCDINFTYLSSFLTHKKYYCSARSSSEEMSPSATA